jgi:two-component system sensor histidine kinase BarA
MLLLTLVPVALVSLFFTFYLIQLRSADAEANLNSRGQNLVRYMSASAELAIYASNLEALKLLSSQLLKVPDVDYTAYFDARQQRLFEQGNAALSIDVNALLDCAKGADVSFASWRFYCEEIFAELPVVDDEINASQTNLRTNLGWVVLALDTSSVGRYQRDVLLTSLMVGALVMLLGALVAWRFSLRISMPIRALAQRSQSPNSESPVTDALLPVDELLVLGEAIESMLGSAERDQRLLREKVEKATEELRALNTDLEKRNQLLRGTQKKLEVAAKSKDMFLARISHELRTPLTTVMGFAGLLKTTKTSEVEQEYLQNITDATHALLYIIDDILTLSKVSEGKVTIDQQFHEIEVLLSMLVAQHGVAAAEKGLELVVNIERDVPTKIVVDDQRLRQILTNFISNSIKFTERGEIAVSVRRVPEKQSICFEVRDSGMGFEPALLEQLLEPFSQADETISRRFGGSGLGLAIAKQLAELLGGSISLVSELGKGTTAAFYLPVEDTLAPLAKAVLSSSVVAYDPSSVVRSSWRRSLTQLFSQVLLPVSWSKFLKAIEGSSCDIVLFGLPTSWLETEKLHALIKDVRAIYSGKIALLYPVGQLSEEFIQSYLHDTDVHFLHKPLMLSSLRPLLGQISQQTPVSMPLRQMLFGLRVLLVEDQKIVRRYMSLLLQHHGAEVLAVAHADEALKVLQDEQIDIIVSDLHMPDINGEQFYKKAQTLLKGNMPPFYIVTADNAAKEHRRLSSIGVSGVIAKPLDEAQLLNMLARHQTREVDSTAADVGLLANVIKHADIAKELHVLAVSVAKNLAANEWGVLQENVHKIRGLAGVAHLPDLSALTVAMMDHARTQDGITIATQLEQLSDIISRVAFNKGLH